MATITNNTIQGRNFHYRDNGGAPKVVFIEGSTSKVVSDVTAITQVIFSAHDQALREMNSNLGTTYTTDFSYA